MINNMSLHQMPIDNSIAEMEYTHRITNPKCHDNRFRLDRQDDTVLQCTRLFSASQCCCHHTAAQHALHPTGGIGRILRCTGMLTD
jgi:hypothetical protein